MKKPKPTLTEDSHYSFRVPKGSLNYYNKIFTPPSDNDADTILNWLYNRGLVQNYIKKLEYETIDDETVEDIILEVWLYLIEMKDKLKLLYDTQGITGLTAYVSGIIARQVHSNTSQIYKKYKRDYKRFIHLSDLCWNDYYNTGKMMMTHTELLTSETEDDIAKRNIENGIYD